MNSNRIYLDHAATTPVRSAVADAMREAADQYNFNPSSLHFEGRRARAALDARGPGSFAGAIIDALHGLDAATLRARTRVS